MRRDKCPCRGSWWFVRGPQCRSWRWRRRSSRTARCPLGTVGVSESARVTSVPRLDRDWSAMLSSRGGGTGSPQRSGWGERRPLTGSYPQGSSPRSGRSEGDLCPGELTSRLQSFSTGIDSLDHFSSVGPVYARSKKNLR